MRKLIKFILGGVTVCCCFILFTNLWIVLSTQSNIYNMETIPPSDVALVLGTSKRTSEGKPNKYFMKRMSAAAALLHKKKIKHLLVSGDNSSKYYNEPRDMLKALGDLKVPENNISLDYAGFRTLDSVVRSKEVFGQDTITIVTQKFHCYRALFIARHFDIHARAYVAGDASNVQKKLVFREILARSYAVVDLYLLRSKPKVMGEKMELDIEYTK